MGPSQDSVMSRLMAAEEDRQLSTLNLVASENCISPQVRLALGSALSNKYAEGVPYKRYYGGCAGVDAIESLAIERAKHLFGAEWVNVQPHSGSQANGAVMLGCLQPGDKILGFDLNHGGHLTHGSRVNFSGMFYQSVFYGVDRETGRVDMEAVARIARDERPRLIICGGSSYSRDWDYARFREIADEVGAFLLADIAHPAGLIARGLLRSPMKHCHFVTTTTHKTLRGARGGMIMMGQDFDNPLGVKDRKGNLRPMSSLLDGAVFPGLQGGPHENNIAGKAVTFYEAATESYGSYIRAVRDNARVLSELLMDKGYTLVSGGTDNHLMLLDLSDCNVTGREASGNLEKANIIVNRNVIPFDTRSPFVTSGVRMGTAAITTRGLRAKDMEEVAEWIDVVLRSDGNYAVLKNVGDAVLAKMSSLPLFDESC